jgi:hypothetical protein
VRVHNIVSPAAGGGYATCPQCSALRKPANQKKQVLHVTVDRDGSWLKTSKKTGQKFLSLSVKLKDTPKPKAKTSFDDEDHPF